MRIRMRGGNPFEGPLLRAFFAGAREAAALVAERAGTVARALAEGAARLAGRVAGRIPPRVAGQIAREAAPAAANAAAPLVSRLGQNALAYFLAAGPAITSAAGAVASAIGSALIAVRPGLGRAVAADPARARRVLDTISYYVRRLFQRPPAVVENAAAAAARVARPLPVPIGPLTPVVRGAEAVARVAGEAAVIRPPIPPTGRLTIDYLRNLLAEGHLDTPKLIGEFFRANPEFKVPSDFLKAVRLPEKQLAQKQGFVRALVNNNRIEGTPAQILEAVSEFIGEDAAARVLEPLANPIVAARAAERAAIEAIPAGAADRAQQIANLIRQGLEKAVGEEAKLIEKATGGESKMQRVMSYFMERFNGVFGSARDMDILRTLIPEAANVVATGVGNAGIAAYSVWLRNARARLVGQMSQDAQRNFMEVMRPEVMGQFRQAMMRVFTHDAALAEEVIENFALRAIPHIERNGAAGPAVDIFLAAVRNAPGNAGRAVIDLIESIAGRVARDAASLALSRARTVGSLPIRLLGRVIAGTATAGVGVFAIMLQGTPNGGGLAQAGVGAAGAAGAIRDRVYEWFGVQLWENPPADNSWGQQLAAAGGFENVAAMREWLAGEGRRWLWSNMSSILTYLATAIGGAGMAALAYFGTSAPPSVEESTTAAVASSASSSASSSGGFKRRRYTKRNR